MEYVFKTNNTKRYRFPTHVNELVMDRSDAVCSEVFIVVLEPGEAPPLHVHDDTEQVYYMLEGSGILSIGEEKKEFPVAPGDVVRIPPSTPHSIKADKKTIRYLAIDCFTSETGKLEPTWDEHVRAICKLHGWEYDDVIE